VATADPVTASGILVLLMMAGLGLVGFVDDFLKIFRQTSLGLRSRAKMAGQLVVAAVFAVEALQHRDGFNLTPADAHLSFLRDFGPAIGTLPFVIWAVFMVVGASNAVNLTDGLDGLASGATIVVLAAYVLIGIWEERNDCTDIISPQCYQVRDPLDLAVVASAVLGGCIGYLWWNAPPAKIIMGDTGSDDRGQVLADLRPVRGNRSRHLLCRLAAPGVIDLRITRAGWSRVRERFGTDPAVRRDPAWRDWIELRLDSAADLHRLDGLLAAAVAANA
jgi:phospho-N-acetylmuramoyl-pentapeptide-transferase